MFKKMVFCGVVLALGGCAVQKFTPTSKFDEGVAKKMLVDGSNTIKGSAFMRQAGGGVVTCAGSSVYLIPATDYAAERLNFIYTPPLNDVSASFSPLYSFKNIESESSEAYVKNTKQTICDQAGNFEFKNIANGEFYVQSGVVWQVGQYFKEGGGLAKKVSVKDGETKTVLMSR